MIRDILLHSLLALDVKTLVSVLFWGNLISLMLVYSFRLASPHARDKALFTYYIRAKLFLTPTYFLLFYRGLLPDLLTVNCGNTLLFIGFYWEARAMLTIFNEDTGSSHLLVTGLAIASIVFFNAVEFLQPADPALRVCVASICVFLILIIPALRLIFGRELSNFKRVVGVFYIVFLSMLLPRAVAALEHSTSLLSNTLIQTMTFLALVLLMIFSLSAYLLLIKESADIILRDMATTDALTGLFNRYTFLLSAERVFEQHKKTGSSLALIFFDIDDFKKANDQFGHSVGDTVLTYFTEALCKGLRGMDISCRYGGEEFLVLLPRAEAEAALKVGHRVQNILREVFTGRQAVFACTVSGGIAAGAPRESDTLMAFIDRADSALYEAKKTGKNKLSVWHGRAAE